MSRVARALLFSGRIVMEEATVDDVRGPTLAEAMELCGKEMGNWRWERWEEKQVTEEAASEPS